MAASARRIVVTANVRPFETTVNRAVSRVRGLTANIPVRGIGGRAASVAGGIGRTIGQGAGIGAGIAIVEQLIQRIFALFEGSDIMVQFAEAMQGVLKAAAPLIGVLLQALTPVIVALTPAIEPLARAFTPLVELLGIGLLGAVLLLLPAIEFAAGGIGRVTGFLRDTVLGIIDFVIRQLNKLPFIDIDFDVNQLAGTFDKAAASIRATTDAADKEAERMTKRTRPDTSIGPVLGNPIYDPVNVGVNVQIDSRELDKQTEIRTRRQYLSGGRGRQYLAGV